MESILFVNMFVDTLEFIIGHITATAHLLLF